MRGNRFPLPRTREERAEFIADRFGANWQQLAPHIRQLRSDFRALKPGETIMNCKTWTEFCKTVLKRSTRAVRYIMAGGNPRSKRKPSKEKSEWKSQWVAMPEFEQNDDKPFKSIKVHFRNQEDVDLLAALVNQKITLNTRYIWYPFMPKNCFTNKRYVGVEPEAESETTMCEVAL
jgi:hypothetical protein